MLAEYIVGKAVNALQSERKEWDAVDLIMPDGTTIEVKSSGYIQSWNQTKPSDIRFDIAMKRSWYADTNTYSDKQERSADIYVFAIHEEKNEQRVDALELSQWSFLVLSTKWINEILGSQKTVGLSTLERMDCHTVGFGELYVEVNRVKDGQVFVIRPEPTTGSPFDVEGIDLDITTDEIIEFIHESRREGA